jgi:uncharacterized protein (DUF1778 family)
MKRTRDPVSEPVTTRLNKLDYDVLMKACEARGEDVATFIRRATLKEMTARGWLDETRRKFLAID